jgi:hypothetical protein
MDHQNDAAPGPFCRKSFLFNTMKCYLLPFGALVKGGV